MKIGGFCTLLFAIGLVALVAGCLEIIAFARVAQVADGSLFTPASPVDPLAVVWAALAVGAVSLLATLVFAFLDLAGTIVLRSRLWKQMAEAHGMDWLAPPAMKAERAGDLRWQQGKAARYSGVLRYRPATWWRRCLRLGDLAAAIRRRVAFVRLAAAVLLSLAWSSIVVQLAVVSLTGRCRPVRVGAHLVVASGSTQQMCHLVHKGTIAAVAVWACWTLLAAILVLLNTHPERLRPHPLDCEFSGIPLNIFGSHPSARGPATASAANRKPPMAAPGQPAAFVPGQSHHCAGGGHQLLMPPKQPVYQHIGMAMAGGGGGGGGQKRMVAKHLRSSWSNIDEDSITSESSRSDNQSLLLSQGKAHLILQPQSMLHQFYNLQNQQLQSMASYLQQPLPHLPKDQLAGHKPPLLQRPVLPNPARRRVQSVLHQSARSPDSALSGPRGIIESSRRMSSATQNAGERTAASGPMQGCDEQGLQLHRLASMRQGPASGATAERSLAPGASQAGAAGAKVTSSHSGKRNTIG